jgi:AbrB family looped-hinge helix DNA binding protein
MNQQASMSTVTVKGQVVIPAKFRKKLGLKRGTRVSFEEQDGNLVVHPVTADLIDRMCGILKGGPSLTRALETSRAQDKAREEAKLERWRRR